MAGWFKVYRDIENHWIWTDTEPFDTRSAWIDLLIMANYSDFKIKHKGKLITRRRGEVNTSSRFLAERWHWSRGRVTRFLKLLESDGMISTHGTTDGTTITIENYSKYQDKSTTDGATNEATDSTTDGATDGANDKNNKENKENKELKKSSSCRGGELNFIHMMTEDEISLLFDEYVDADYLIDEAEADARDKHKNVWAAYRYIVGYAHNKAWPRKES